MTTGIAIGEQPQAQLPAIPTNAELNTIMRLAEVLAESALVPTAYQRKPANIVLAALAGRPYGWDPAMAMRSFHIIEGVPSMKPELMLALVRRAGHSVTGKVTGEGANISATVKGKRRDTGDEFEFTFSVQDAVAAGLCTIKDGRPYSRTSTGKKKPWEAHPKSMCWARALSQVCRSLFSDVLLGVSYTPEELGADVDADGTVIDEEPIDVPWAQKDAPAKPLPDMVKVGGVKSALVRLYQEHGFEQDEAVTYAADVWEKRGLPASGSMPRGDADALLAQVAAELNGEAADAAAATTDEGDNTEDAVLLASAKQVQRIKIAQREAGIEDGVYRALLLSAYGVDSAKKLTVEQADELIDRLTKEAEERMADAEHDPFAVGGDEEEVAP